jgi:hypothetical protein
VADLVTAQPRQVFTDRGLAIVSLLAGALETYSPADIRNPEGVIRAERKIMAVARRRRGHFSALNGTTRGKGTAVPATPSVGMPARTTRRLRTVRVAMQHGKESPARAAARRTLEAEYAETFGVSWDRPPWGHGSWATDMQEALRLDRVYLECEGRIERMAAALDAGIEHLAAMKVDLNVRDASAEEFDKLTVGLTQPEAVLYRLFARTPCLTRARARLRDLLHQLETDWNLGCPDEEAMAALRLGEQPKPPVLAATTSLTGAAPHRGFVYVTMQDHAGKANWVGWAPCIVFPPPRSSHADSAEWRRWWVTGALDKYFFHGGQAAREQVTDRAIAVVSLLTGGLERVHHTRLSSLQEVVSAERKAVALVRKRMRALIKANTHEPVESAEGHR